MTLRMAGLGRPITSSRRIRNQAVDGWPKAGPRAGLPPDPAAGHDDGGNVTHSLSLLLLAAVDRGAGRLARHAPYRGTPVAPVARRTAFPAASCRSIRATRTSTGCVATPRSVRWASRVDLALLAIPAAAVALRGGRNASRAGVKNALIISSGFAEEGGACRRQQVGAGRGDASAPASAPAVRTARATSTRSAASPRRSARPSR